LDVLSLAFFLLDSEAKRTFCSIEIRSKKMSDKGGLGDKGKGLSGFAVRADLRSETKREIFSGKKENYLVIR